jgi:adenylate cyclase
MTHSNLQSQIDTANRASTNGNYDEAEMLANEVLSELDKHPTQALPKRDSLQELDSPVSSSFPFGEGRDGVLLRANALLSLASTNMRRGRYDTAFERAEQALALAEEHSLENVKPKCWSIFGNVYNTLSEYRRALEYYAQALATHEELGQEADAARVTGGIGNVYRNLSDYPRALEYMSNALAAHEVLGNKEDAARVTSSIGNVYTDLADYPRALEYFTNALATHEALGNKAGAAIVTGNIGSVYLNLSDYPRALEYFTNALTAHEALGQKAAAAIVTGNIGSVYNYLADYSRALEYYGKAIATHEELGQKAAAARVTGNIGNVYLNLSDSSSALEYYGKALAAHDELGQKAEAALVTGNIGSLYGMKNFAGYDAVRAEEYLLKSIAMSEEIGTKHLQYSVHKSLADLYKIEKRWEECQMHFEKYHEIEKEVQSEEAKKQATLMEQRREAAEREKQIAIAKAAADAKHQATEELLHNVLPPTIAEKMLGGTKLIAEKIPSVSVLFADIVNFTNLSQRITPEELVEGLDGIFSAFDALAEKHGLEKIKTIGDAYMVVSGAPVQRADHAEAMAHFAFDMVEVMKEFRSSTTGEEIQLRIGIHSGEVVAGVIGKKKFAYDMWGDAVNTASRMESHGEPGKIHVSVEFKHAVETLHATSLQYATSLQFIPRGELDIKGKGTMRTYFLTRGTN